MKISELIIEGMQYFSSNSHALCIIEDKYPIFVLYNIHKPSMSEAILGTCSIIHYKDNLWIVNMIFTKHGYGPLMYAIISQYIADRNGILIPSATRSKASKKTWEQFDKNPYVDIVKLDDFKTAMGTIANQSPTGFGIVGNNTLDIQPAIQKDIDENKNNNTWHQKLISTAILKMKKAMDRI